MNAPNFKTLKARYRIITPLFIGDCYQKATYLSPASIKGALRFWWRALNWMRVHSFERIEEDALLRLQLEESDLFGSADGNAGQAKFLLRVKFKNSGKPHNDWPIASSPSGYLGIGLWESGSVENKNFKPAREYVNENQTFIVELICKPNLSDEAVMQLQDALKAWGFLGGLGSRSRRGFGSVAIESLVKTKNQNNDLEEIFKFDSTQNYKETVTDILKRYRYTIIQKPPYTAFCEKSQFCIIDTPIPDARSAHAELGEAFKNYRGQPSEMRGSKKRVFGMPYAGGTAQEAQARRASPLLFHIHPIGAYFVGTVLFMPATFHSDRTFVPVDFELASGFLKTWNKAMIV
jgi:CRISPR-associated protein Cmr1